MIIYNGNLINIFEKNGNFMFCKFLNFFSSSDFFTKTLMYVEKSDTTCVIGKSLSLLKLYMILIIFLFLFIQTSTSVYAANDFPLAVDSRIKTFIYTANNIFPVNVNYGYQTFIEFSPSEIIKTIATGDSVSWSITPTGNRIFIRALEKSGRTNMTVITTKRSYIFDLIAKEKVDEVDKELTYCIKFYYPEKLEDVSNTEDKTNETLLSLSSRKNLNTDYKFAGDKSIQPLEIFDNGKVTFFKFANNIPKIFVLKSDNIEYSTKMVLFGDYVTIDGVHQNITLRYKESFAKLTNIKKK